MKSSAWLFTIIGELLVLGQLKVVDMTASWVLWVIALAVLVMGITKLMVAYKAKRRR